MNLGIELTTILIEIILLGYFFISFMGRSIIAGTKLYFCILGYGTILFLLSYEIPASFWRSFIIIFMTLIFIKFLLKKGWLITIYSISLFFSSSILSDVFCGTLLQSTGISIDELMGSGPSRIIYISTGKIVHLFLLYIILRINKRNLENAILIKSLPLISCLLFSTIVCYRNFIALAGENVNSSVMLETVVLLYINILICTYVEILNHAYMKQKETELAKQQLEVRESYYHDMVARQEETRSLWHDIKKYIMTMEALVGHENQEEARQCLEDVHTSFAALQNTIDTGNTIIDGILAYGMKKADKADVIIRPNVWLDSNLHIPASDLFVIMGNTMDNAIEACSVLPEKEERIVSISLNQKNHLLSYEISNQYQPGGKKKHGKIHGYGLRNVETLVDKNGGNMTVTKDNQQFIVSICLNV